MTDTNTAFEPNETDLADATDQCLKSFQTCLVRASSIHPRELSRIEDQAARFSSWTSRIGAFAPGQSSMDYRLQYAPEVQSVTLGLLDSLNSRIQKCKLEYSMFCSVLL